MGSEAGFYRTNYLIYLVKYASMLRKIQKNKYSSLILRVLKKNRVTILTILLLFIAADIFYIPGNSDVRIFMSLLLYGICIFLYNIKSRWTVLICLSLLAILYYEFLLSPGSEKSEKAAVWLVLFLAIAIMQQWKE